MSTEDPNIATLREALTLLEEHVHSLRIAVEIAQRREPTQAEGDAHEWRQPSGAPDDGGDGPPGECFVPAGGWAGRRCRVCNRWVWGGPTACVGCARVEVDRIRSELTAILSRHVEQPDDAFTGHWVTPPTPPEHVERLAAVTRAAQALVLAADACDREAERPRASQSSAPMVRQVNAMAKLREALRLAKETDNAD